MVECAVKAWYKWISLLCNEYNTFYCGKTDFFYLSLIMEARILNFSKTKRLKINEKKSHVGSFFTAFREFSALSPGRRLKWGWKISDRAVVLAQTDVTSPRGAVAAVPVPGATAALTHTALCLVADATSAPATTRNRRAAWACSDSASTPPRRSCTISFPSTGRSSGFRLSLMQRLVTFLFCMFFVFLRPFEDWTIYKNYICIP